MATQSRGLGREERRGGTRRLAGSGATELPGRARPGGLAPTGGPGSDKWARIDRWGQEEFLIRNQNTKLQGKIKGFRKTF
jgi:hypothetical protein